MYGSEQFVMDANGGRICDQGNILGTPQSKIALRHGGSAKIHPPTPGAQRQQ